MGACRMRDPMHRSHTAREPFSRSDITRDPFREGGKVRSKQGDPLADTLPSRKYPMRAKRPLLEAEQAGGEITKPTRGRLCC
jgi:hypothetical protein